MRKHLIIATALFSLSAHATTKCRNSKGILYTQEPACPAGYTFITSDVSGNVSTIGKSAEILAQEKAAAERRKAEQSRIHEQELRQQQAETVALQAAATQPPTNTSACKSLAQQALMLEEAMRRNSTEFLKEQHRYVRDQQYRSHC